MRIISGKHKGRRVIAPKKLPVRPTTDMAKEGIFNILNNRIYFPETTVLDLFSGTGNISYEFASRGTTQITAVDGHYGCVKFILSTAKSLEAPIETVKSDVYLYLEKCGRKFELIFADPPYNFSLEEFEKIISLVFEQQVLEAEGLLVIEHSKHTDLSKVENFTESRRYGGSAFSFFSKNDPI